MQQQDDTITVPADQRDHQPELADAADTVTLPRAEYDALTSDADRWRTHTADSNGLCPYRDAAIWRRDIGALLWKHQPEGGLSQPSSSRRMVTHTSPLTAATYQHEG